MQTNQKKNYASDMFKDSCRKHIFVTLPPDILVPLPSYFASLPDQTIIRAAGLGVSLHSAVNLWEWGMMMAGDKKCAS